MSSLWQDLRFAVRLLLRSPGFTAAALVALILGIGANAAIFSLVNAVLLRPLPYEHSERLMFYSGLSLGTDNIALWKQGCQACEQFAGASLEAMEMSGIHDPEELRGLRVSSEFMPMLNIRPALGRSILADDIMVGSAPVVLVSDAVWRRELNADPNAVGRTLILDRKAHVIVGVMPRDFGPLPYNRIDLWLPLVPARPQYAFAIGRLKPGIGLRAARAEAQAIASRLRVNTHTQRAEPIVEVQALKDRIVGESRITLLVLLGGVGFVLLIACANVATMLLARAAARTREIVIRVALGARPARIARQLLTESMLLSGIAAVLGLILAHWTTRAFLLMLPYRIPRVEEARIDGTVLAFTTLLAVLTTLTFGLAPALQASRTDLTTGLKEGGLGVSGSRTHRRTHNLIVVSQIAFSLVLLVGAGLLLKTFLVLRPTHPGFDPATKLAVEISLPSIRYAHPTEKALLLRQAIERLRNMPTVREVAAVSDLPLTGVSHFVDIAVGGETAGVHYRVSTENFFREMGMPITRGRDFGEGDDEHAPRVAIINQALARRFFADQDPIGQRIAFPTPDARVDYVVIGVVRDSRIFDSTTASRPELYVPFWQDPVSRVALVIQGDTSSAGNLDSMRAALRGVDPDLIISDMRSMDQILSDSVAYPRFHALLLGSLAGLALVLAIVGIYSVVAYSVVQRTREISIRMALGAEPRNILGLVLGDGFLLAFVGIGLGLAGALLLSRYLKTLLFEVPSNDVPTFAAVTLLWFVVVMLACWVPASRAMRIDPVNALRHE